MLPCSLAKLGEDFNVATLKLKFPYKFASKDHLFYAGYMPGIEYYDDIKLKGYYDMSVPFLNIKV